MFDDILQRKKAFLDYKKQKFKKSKLETFPKGLVHGFGQNLKIFHVFFFGKISKHNVFDDILERKKAFLDYKKQRVKKVKHWDFSKGVSP